MNRASAAFHRPSHDIECAALLEPAEAASATTTTAAAAIANTVSTGRATAADGPPLLPRA